MGENGEVVSDELGSHEADEQDVLEDTTTERDDVEPGSLAELGGGFDDEPGDRDVEPGRDSAERATGPDVIDDGTQDRGGIDAVVGPPEPILARVPGWASAIVSSSIAACASYETTWRIPSNELTTSNNLPMLDVGTHWTSRSS